MVDWFYFLEMLMDSSYPAREYQVGAVVGALFGGLAAGAVIVSAFV